MAEAEVKKIRVDIDGKTALRINLQTVVSNCGYIILNHVECYGIHKEMLTELAYDVINSEFSRHQLCMFSVHKEYSSTIKAALVEGEGVELLSEGHSKYSTKVPVNLYGWNPSVGAIGLQSAGWLSKKYPNATVVLDNLKY